MANKIAAVISALLLLPGAVLAQTLKLASRLSGAPAGSEFARRIAPLPLAELGHEIDREIKSGNVPEFLRRL